MSYILRLIKLIYNSQIEPTPKGRELPPEFQELANIVEQNQKKSVSFEPIQSSFPSIPEGQNMFKNINLNGTNTQKITELQLKFQNEVSSLKSEISVKHNEILSLV